MYMILFHPKTLNIYLPSIHLVYTENSSHHSIPVRNVLRMRQVPLQPSVFLLPIQILRALLLSVPMPTFPRELRRDVGDEREEGDDVEAEVLRGVEVARRRLEVFRAPRRRHVLEQPDGVVHRVVPLQRQQVRQLVDVVVVTEMVLKL